MKVNILGTEYEIIKKKYDEDEAFDRRSIAGYCDCYAKRIVICDMNTYKGWEHEDADTKLQSEKVTLRHEIIHAFFGESGLQDSTFVYDGAWSKNEEMIDWLAFQTPKMCKAFAEAGCL